MTTTTGTWQRPTPTPTSLSKPFWEATKRGQLVMQQCTQCKEFVWTPQMACRKCLTETLEWKPVSGKGTIHTFSVIYRAANPAFKAPYTIVVVDLEEGTRILSDLIGIDPADVRIGMKVEVEFEDAGDVGLYHFRPRR
ncbi:MAG: Zn-ribbon domain-containing OB-fold protein [SAR202 cluster bacterium]|nr:Zn-ribbon domain-containing OB-fold protein [SAR202 cluster bacterium]